MKEDNKEISNKQMNSVEFLYSALQTFQQLQENELTLKILEQAKVMYNKEITNTLEDEVKETKQSYSVNYNVCAELVGVINDEVIITGTINDERDDISYENVHIIISLETYNKMISQWIDMKRDYCERYNVMCGWCSVWGHGDVSKRLVYSEECFDCTNMEFYLDSDVFECLLDH